MQHLLPHSPSSSDQELSRPRRPEQGSIYGGPLCEPKPGKMDSYKLYRVVQQPRHKMSKVKLCGVSDPPREITLASDDQTPTSTILG